MHERRLEEQDVSLSVIEQDRIDRDTNDLLHIFNDNMRVTISKSALEVMENIFQEIPKNLRGYVFAEFLEDLQYRNIPYDPEQFQTSYEYKKGLV